MQIQAYQTLITTDTAENIGSIPPRKNKSWCINTLGAEHGLLIGKKAFNDAVMQAYESEMQSLKQFRDKYDPEAKEPDSESYSYYGTIYPHDIYPHGGKMKHMKYFYSTKHTIPAEKFLKKNSFSIHISIYDPKDYRTVEEQTVFVLTADDIIMAEQVY